MLTNVVLHEDFEPVYHILHLPLHILEHGLVGEGACVSLPDFFEDALADLVVDLTDLRPVLVDLVVYVVKAHEDALTVFAQQFKLVCQLIFDFVALFDLIFQALLRDP